MSISPKEILHIAHLARIELAPGEREKFKEELSRILEFVAKLNELDISGVKPLTGGTELENVMRADEPSRTGGEREVGADLIARAPQTRRGFVEVKAVFERE
ncbi:MAG: Asp-tRNA(Asn)/Glu-tRNA(Gln) amidotransferase subunit GatC [Candidatus Sungbacteria bacterium]|uniref:Aspartyl/glutamyl-tRNA(Asn/Gln) amidotransferase subunit C n=1 Tax=Candidatus Sungiibacteriota bacterium TaxID=2750080 RepID=A0A932YZ39_9BACT|nr:Asp-tRNA(Asn)/Glu-tRNA(Gln) amidotransferase subunit GatC [Candidatus Sungbacteria bacterium]